MGQKSGSFLKRPSMATKRPSEVTQPAVRRNTANNQNLAEERKTSINAEMLNVYAKRNAGSDAKLGKKSSSSSIKRNGSSQEIRTIPSSASNNTTTHVAGIQEDSTTTEKKPLFDHLVAFYFRNDHERLMKGDVDIDGICEWALSGGPDGITLLNSKLRDKYGEDLDSFLIAAELPPPPPEEEDGGDFSDNSSQVSSNTNEEHQELDHEVTLSRPAIPKPRRRKTNQPNQQFVLNEDGELAIPLDAQLDHPPPPDLRHQLTELINSSNPDRINEVDRFLKFSEEHGLIALNSELLVEFGKDMKGNTFENPIEGEGGNNNADAVIRKFGVGLSASVLSEMHGKKLHHEDVGVVTENVDTGVCNKFRLDTESPVFGMCKCGHERPAHFVRQSVIKSATLERKFAERRASQLPQSEKPKTMIMEEVPIPQNKPAQQETTPLPTENKPFRSGSSVSQMETKSTTPIENKPFRSGSSVSQMETKSTPIENKPFRSGSSVSQLETKLTQPTENKPIRSGSSVSQLEKNWPPKPTNSNNDRKGSTNQIVEKEKQELKSADNGIVHKPPPPKIPNPHNHENNLPHNFAAPPRPKSKPKPSARPKSMKKFHTDGTIERLPPTEKKSEPCDVSTFVLDMAASEFGMCGNCGWKKSDHKVSNVDPTPPRPMSLKFDGPKEPCQNYKLDLTADTFGACVCGFSKQAHKGQSSNQQAVSKTLEKRWKNLKEVV